MTILLYKDYEIDAIAEQLADSAGWRSLVNIYAHMGDRNTDKPFETPEIHETQEEAIRFGLNFGKQIIDGELKGYSIEDF